MPQILQIAAIAAATLGTGAATLTVMNEDIPDLAVPAGDWTASSALDGISYSISGRDLASGTVLEDVIVFKNGTFQSTNCEEYCDFGWSDYQTKEVDGVIHFTATAICPYAPHTVVWHGTITSDEIVFDVSWTTRRWYWTHQIRAQGSGQAILPQSVTG